jgi:hypothetical protein
LISEYIDLKNSVEKIGITLDGLKNEYFEGKLRYSKLSPLFIAIDKAVKECRKERNIGKDKFFEKFSQLVENVEDVLLKFRKMLLDEKDIINRDRAVRIYLEHVHGKLKEALDELRRDITLEAQRARTALKSTFT